jgi:glutathione S-transferase
MRLYYAPTSPYVRKVMVVVHELMLSDKVELIPLPPGAPLSPSIATEHNPTGKVPTLILATGEAVYDSPVICETLEAEAGVPGSLHPMAPGARWRALSIQALADGLIEAAIIARQETVMRPEGLRWPVWSAFQLGKVAACLDRLEKTDLSADHVTIAEIAVGCALSYLDFRFAALDWRHDRPAIAVWHQQFAARKSMTATEPPR